MNIKSLYKFDTIICFLLLLLSMIAGIVLKPTITEQILSDLITFLSIIVGFQIASFSIMFTLPAIKDLYKKLDAENKRITLKHRLKNYYKFTFELALLSILFIFLLELLPLTTLTINYNLFGVFVDTIDITWIERVVVFSILSLNIYTNYRTIGFLYKIFIRNN